MFGKKFAPQKSILGTAFTNTLEYVFVPSFISNKPLWSLGKKFAPKKVFSGQSLEKNCQVQNLHPWILLCTEFRFKQSRLNF